MNSSWRALWLSLPAFLFVVSSAADPARESGRFAVASLKARDLEALGAQVGPQNFSITEDRRGVFYFANNLGVIESHFRPIEGIATQCYTILAEGDTLLAATREGIFAIRDEKATKIDPAFAYRLQQSPNPDRVVAGYDDGVGILEREGATWRVTARVTDAGHEVVGVLDKGDGEIWGGTDSNGLYRLTVQKADSGSRLTITDHFTEKSGLRKVGFTHGFSMARCALALVRGSTNSTASAGASRLTRRSREAWGGSQHFECSNRRMAKSCGWCRKTRSFVSDVRGQTGDLLPALYGKSVPATASSRSWPKETSSGSAVMTGCFDTLSPTTTLHHPRARSCEKPAWETGR